MCPPKKFGGVSELTKVFIGWHRIVCPPKKFGGLSFKDLRKFNLAVLGKQA